MVRHPWTVTDNPTIDSSHLLSRYCHKQHSRQLIAFAQPLVSCASSVSCSFKENNTFQIQGTSESLSSNAIPSHGMHTSGGPLQSANLGALINRLSMKASWRSYPIAKLLAPGLWLIARTVRVPTGTGTSAVVHD